MMEQKKKLVKETIESKKRASYLSFFEDGVTDAICEGEKDPDKTFSHYYKKGYDCGARAYAKLLKKEYQVE